MNKPICNQERKITSKAIFPYRRSALAFDKQWKKLRKAINIKMTDSTDDENSSVIIVLMVYWETAVKLLNLQFKKPFKELKQLRKLCVFRNSNPFHQVWSTTATKINGRRMNEIPAKNWTDKFIASRGSPYAYTKNQKVNKKKN